MQHLDKARRSISSFSRRRERDDFAASALMVDSSSTPPHLRDVLRCAVVSCAVARRAWDAWPNALNVAATAIAAGPACLRSVAPHLFTHTNLARRYDWMSYSGAKGSTVACRLLHLVPGAVDEIDIEAPFHDAARVLAAAHQTQQLRSLTVNSGWASPGREQFDSALATIVETAGPSTLRRFSLRGVEATLALSTSVSRCVLLQSLSVPHGSELVLPPTLRDLTLIDPTDGKDLMRIAGALPNLRVLRLQADGPNRVNAESWAHGLASLLPRLEQLELWGVDQKWFDAAVAILASSTSLTRSGDVHGALPLRSFTLYQATLDATWMQFLITRAPLLEELSFWRTTPAAAALLPRFTRCACLSLRWPVQIKDAHLAQLVTAMPQLRTLHVGSAVSLDFHLRTYYKTPGWTRRHKLRALSLGRLGDDGIDLASERRVLLLFRRLVSLDVLT